MIALLYDVHGNLPALEAVLADAKAAGATGYVIGGDVALFGPWPSETVGRLRELDDARWLRGNGERWVADPSGAPDDETVQGAIRACRRELGEAQVRGLAGLPESVALGDTTRCWHGCPISDVRSFMPQPTGDEEEMLDGASERRLVFGHTHLPFARTSQGGIELVNPGSIGMPFDGDPRAAYALLDGDRVEHRRIAYDHEASAAALPDRFDGAAWTETVARRISTARF